MANPKPILDLTEDGVITQAALRAYAEGLLGDAERAQMDKLLQDDPFAQEALDGLRQSQSPEQIPIAITSINTQLREKTGLRERRKKGIEIHWTVYAYTVVILAVLIGLGFVLVHFTKGKEQQPTNQTIPQAEESAPLVESVKMDTLAKDSVQPVVDAKIDGTETPLDTIKKADTAKITKPAPAIADKPTLTSDDLKSKNVISPETAVQLDVAKAYFESGDYQSAEKKYNEILASYPDNLDALYFGGVSSYLNETKGLGEANFDKLIKAGFYTDGTKWYKANILIRRGQKEAAKQLLRDLVNSSSSYKDRAIKKYEELYK